MRKTLALFVLIVGCNEADRVEIRHRPFCSTPEERKALAESIIACSKAANPMSDEEGEDLVAQCQASMAVSLCPERRVIVRFRPGVGEIDSRLDVGAPASSGR